MMAINSKGVLLFREFITSKTRPLGIRNLYAGKVLNDGEDEESKELSSGNDKQSKMNSSENLEQIYDYFKSYDFSSQAEKLPGRIIMQRKSKPDSLYLFDHEVAETMTDAIKDDLLADPHKIIEANAGTGVLTEKLLSAGLPTIRVMEPNVKFAEFLHKMEHFNKIILHGADLFNVWKIAHRDKYDNGNRVANLFLDIPQIEWGEETGLKIIGPVANICFLNHVILNIVKQCGLISYGRPCFYLAMPPSVWMRFTSNRAAIGSYYRSATVLFQLFFDYELLRQVPRKAFLPWIPSHTVKLTTIKSKIAALDREYMYIVKIVGKKNLFTEIIDVKHIKPLWFFLNHHMMARTNRVIPSMEAWEPGCGPSLIMQDFNIFTQFGDLAPQEILHLFKIFTTYDGYQNSFLPWMDNSLHKMEQLIF